MNCGPSATLNLAMSNLAERLHELTSFIDEVLLDSRPRDNTGQYAPQQAGWVDPMAMRQAYEHIRRQEAQKKQATWGAVKRGVMTAGLVAGAGFVGHKVGKTAGATEGFKAGGKAMRKKWAVGQKRAVGNLQREKEGLGEIMRRAQQALNVEKDVSADRLAEIRRLNKRKK